MIRVGGGRRTPNHKTFGNAGLSLPMTSFSSIAYDPRITFTRASAGTYFDSTGTLVTQGYNYIRNNTMQGASAGTPGTLPTNWLFQVTTTTGLTSSVVGSGTESGINYLDFRLQGTAGTGSGSFQMFMEGFNVIAASTGQTWAGSWYWKLQSGSMNGLSAPSMQYYEYTSAPAYIKQTGAACATPTSAALNTQRQTTSATLSGGVTTAFVIPALQMSIANGAAIDITLRIGMPQLELASTAGTVTATTNAANGGPRFDYNPSTLAARGLLIEEARTNSIRNNTMQGASAPSTYPTNWVISLNGTATGSVSAVSTEDGISYIDIRIQESVSGASSIIFEATTQIVAADTQTWTNSLYYKLSGGSLTNVSLVENRIVYRTAAGAAVTSQNVAFTPTSAALRTQRVTNTFTASGGTIARVTGQVAVTFTGAGDITLRIGMPQLELGAFATSVISTSSAAVTRSADIASITGASFSSFWNATQGTIVARYMLAKAANGSNQFAARASDNTYNNQIGAINTNSTGFAGISTASGGVFDGAASAPVAVVDNVFTTVASSYSAAGISISKDGTAVVSDNTLTFPTGMTRLDIGGDHIGANHFGSGWISSLYYYPTIGLNLQALST